MAPHRSTSHSVYSVTESVDRLSLSPQGVNERSDSLSIRTGRKMYKAIGRLSSDTITDSKQLVWPPFLEDALFEGLRRYRPNSKRDPELLQRFPGRNKFISEFILEVTEKKRSPKQVGSRLQQLRETCLLPWVQYLIGNKDFSSSRPRRLAQAMSESLPSPRTRRSPKQRRSPASSETTLVETPSTSRSSTVTLHSTSKTQPIAPRPPSTFFVSLSLEESYTTPLSSSAFTLDLDESSMCYLPTPSSSYTFSRYVRLEVPSPASQYSAFVNFSSTRLAANSQYLCVSSLYKDKELVETDADQPVYLENIDPRSSTLSTSISPRYWAAIVCDDEPQRYTIVHDIFVAAELEPTPSIFQIQYTIDGVSALPHSTAAALPESSDFDRDFGQWNAAVDYVPENITTSHYPEPFAYASSYLPHPASFYDHSFNISPSAPAYALDHYAPPYGAY